MADMIWALFSEGQGCFAHENDESMSNVHFNKGSDRLEESCTCFIVIDPVS